MCWQRSCCWPSSRCCPRFGNYYYDGADAKLFPPGDPTKPRIWPENYNRARVTSAVITGVYLISDDFSACGDPVLKERAVKFLRNPEINALAARGRSFRPVDGNTGFKANNLYVLKDGRTTYLAVFNVDSTPRAFTLDPDRIGLDKRNRFRELWSGKYLHHPRHDHRHHPGRRRRPLPHRPRPPLGRPPCECTDHEIGRTALADGLCAHKAQ